MLGKVAAVVFLVAFGGGLGFWYATTYRYPVEPSRLLGPFLIAVVLFIAHVYEEYVTDFEHLMSDLSGSEVSERSFLTVAAFVGPSLWILTGVLVSARRPFGYYLISAFVIAMTVAELSHFVFPFLEDGTFHYTSGMLTAALPLIPTAVLAKRLLEGTREQRLADV